MDANATLSQIKRRGLGKSRRINTNYLWVQEKHRSKEIKYSKVQGTKNNGDLFTKYLTSEVMSSHLERMDREVRGDKDAIALELDVLKMKGKKPNEDRNEYESH